MSEEVRHLADVIIAAAGMIGMCVMFGASMIAIAIHLGLRR